MGRRDRKNRTGRGLVQCGVAQHNGARLSSGGIALHWCEAESWWYSAAMVVRG